MLERSRLPFRSVLALSLLACGILAQRTASLAGPAASPAAPAATAAPAVPAAAPEAPTAPGSAASGPTRKVDLGVIAFEVPSTWISEEPASSMRQAQIKIPRAAGETLDGELLVFYFGPSAGSVDANVQRWYEQIEAADGKPAEQVATRTTLKAGAVDVTFIDVAGKIKASAMPGAPARPQIEKGRMLAAIAQTSMGPWFFKATGPAATMAAALAGFKGLVQSIKVTPVPQSGSGAGMHEGPETAPSGAPAAAPAGAPQGEPQGPPDAGSDTEKH